MRLSTGTETPLFRPPTADDVGFLMADFILWCCRENDSDIKRRELGVCFSGLRVLGVGATASHQETVGSMLNPKVIWQACRSSLRPPATRTILHDFNGVMRPGEMLRESICRSRDLSRYKLTHITQSCWGAQDPVVQHSSR